MDPLTGIPSHHEVLVSLHPSNEPVLKQLPEGRRWFGRVFGGSGGKGSAQRCPGRRGRRALVFETSGIPHHLLLPPRSPPPLPGSSGRRQEPVERAR